MKWVDLLALLGDEVVFRTSFLLSGRGSATGVRRQLDRWVKSGRIVMLRRGAYAVQPPFARRSPHPFAVANTLRQASYVSLHSALAHHGMIPEHVPAVTSVTTNRPEELATPLGRFAFRHVQRRMFFGFRMTEVAPGQIVRLATPEKALVDLLYLTPDSDRPAWLEEMRLERVPALGVERLRDAVVRCGSAKVARAVRLLDGIWRERGEGTAL